MSRFFGSIRQNGYVVRDIRAAMDHWVNVLGVGPWFYAETAKTDWFMYRGQPSHVEMSVALANTGDLQIELIQPRNDAPSLYLDFLKAGHEGLQHIAYWSKDYQEVRDALIAKGQDVAQEGCVGGKLGRFAYFELPGPHPGALLEISDISGHKGKLFDDIRHAAAQWDGSSPVREIKQRP